MKANFLLLIIGITLSSIGCKENDLARIATGQPFCISIDYSETLDQMIINGEKALGNSIGLGYYHCKKEYINAQNFPSPKELTGKNVSVTAKIFDFHERFSKEDVIKEMSDSNYRPANLFELLAVTIKYPELQASHKIIALGSSWCDIPGHCSVPVLTEKLDPRNPSPWLKLESSNYSKMLALFPDAYFLGVQE